MNALNSSKKVPVLLHSIEISASDAHPSGHALCHALSSSWTSLLHETESDQAKKPPQAGLCSQTANQGDGGRPSSMFWAQVALDYSWEQLHSGHWMDVKLFWREAYAFAALLKGLNLYLLGQVAQSLVEIDKGILMGAPIINNSLHTVATMASKELEAEKVGVVSVQKGVASMLNNDNTGYVVTKSDGTDLPKRIGKVRFRNYTPTSHYTKGKGMRSSSSSIPMVRSLSDTPIIDMARRISVVHCPSLEEFQWRHMVASVPVVVSGAMDHWSAYAEKKWK